MWRMTSPDGASWVQHDGTDWDADGVTAQRLTEGAARPVDVAPNAGVYRPTGPGDELGVFLLARAVMPGPVHIAGQPPAVPAAPPGPTGVAF